MAFYDCLSFLSSSVEIPYNHTAAAPWLCVSLKLYPLRRSNLHHLLGPGMGRHRTVCTEQAGGVSRCIPLLHHFEINERKESDPEVLTFSLLQTRTNFGDLGDPARLFQKGPSKWNFNSICSLPLVLSCGTRTGSGMGFNFQETIH